MDALFPPGPQQSLLLGNAVQFRNDPLNTMVSAAHDYGEIVHFRFGPSHAYLVTSAETMHYVLAERPDLFDAKSHFYRAIQSAFGHEWFTPKDGAYKRQPNANKLSPDWLVSLRGAICGIVTETISQWKSGDTIDVHQALSTITLRIAAQAVFGMDADSTIQQLSQHLPNSAALQDRRFVSPWALRLPAADRAQELVLSLLRQAKTATACNSDSLSDRQIANELIRLFHLLHETAATTLSWTLLMLAQNPEADADLCAELTVLCSDSTTTSLDIDALEQTEMTLRETMRLYPPAWLISRQARRETRLGDFFLPAGSTILCSPYIMHRSPRNVADPITFLPARFASGYEKRMRRYSYAPLGVSAYSEETALLTEMKVVLAELASRFTFIRDDESPVLFDVGVTLRPKNGLRLHVEARG